MSYKIHQRFRAQDDPSVLVSKLNRMQTELERAIGSSKGTIVQNVSTGGGSSSGSSSGGSGTDADAQTLLWLGW